MTGFANLQSIEVVHSYFRECASIVNVNWNNAKLTDNNGAGMFNNCANLQRVTNISNAVVNMRSAFSNCTSLTDSPTIPNSVRDIREVFSGCINLHNCSTLPERALMLDSAFRNCHSLTNPPAIPSGIQSMAYTFYYCNNLQNAPDLSKCVALTNMFRCFAYNYNLTQTPVIPNNVTNICNTFQGCTSITSFPIIPNSVTNLSYTFDQCRNVVKCNVNIPTQITDMSYTFYRCTGLTGKIFITGENITNAVNCFGETTSNKKVYIPFKNSSDDTVNSETYNAFITTGYDESGTTDGVTLFDLAEYEPPVRYDFRDDLGEARTFSWEADLTTTQDLIAGITEVSTIGVVCGDNMTYAGTWGDRNQINHTSHNEQSPSPESYIGFIFNVASGMFKPKVLEFDVSKNGTDGGSVMVTMQFDNTDEEIICTLPTIARNNADPSYTHTALDLSLFDMGASQGTVTIRFYLYNQGNTKSFSVYNVNLSGLLLLEEIQVYHTIENFNFANTEIYPNGKQYLEGDIVPYTSIIDNDPSLSYGLIAHQGGSKYYLMIQGGRSMRIMRNCKIEVPTYGQNIKLGITLYSAANIIVDDITYSLSKMETMYFTFLNRENIIIRGATTATVYVSSISVEYF